MMFPNKASLFFFIILCGLFLSLANAPALAQTPFLDKGIEAFERGDYDEALVQLEQSAKIEHVSKTQRIEVHKFLAYIYLGMDQSEQAEGHLIEALTADPSFSPQGDPMFGAPKMIAAFSKARSKVDIVHITSDPSGADVVIDGLFFGKTPCDAVLKAPKTVKISIQAESRSSIERTLQTIGGRAISFHEQLNLAGGRVMIITEPEGATIFLDNREMGRTPCILPNIAPKTYKVRLVLAGRREYHQDLVVEPGKVATLRTSLVPLKSNASKSEHMEMNATESNLGYKVAGYILVAGSIASLSTSGVFIGQAFNYADKAGSAGAKDEYNRDLQNGKNAEMTSYIAGGVGVALGAAAVALLYKGYHSKPSKSAAWENYRVFLSHEGAYTGLGVIYVW